jgi:uncharacterized protein YqgV (UPF0045/DUF77 family)
MLTNDADRKKFMNAIKEISNSMIRMEGERDLIKTIVNDQSDEFQIPKKLVSKIAKTYHKQNIADIEAEWDEFMEIYDAITANKHTA